MIALRRLGITARVVRPGYSRSLDHFVASADRPIDILFAGTHTLRRTRYLAAAARVLARHECRLELVGPDDGSDTGIISRGGSAVAAHAEQSGHQPACRGDEPQLEWREALEAIHAGAVFVSEHSSGIAPLTPGEHLLVAGPDALPYVAETLLRDPERLARMRSAAYERVSTWIPFALSVSVLRALIVELVGEPVPTVVGPGPPPDAPLSCGGQQRSVWFHSQRGGSRPHKHPCHVGPRPEASVTALVVADGRDGLTWTLDSVRAQPGVAARDPRRDHAYCAGVRGARSGGPPGIPTRLYALWRPTTVSARLATGDWMRLTASFAWSWIPVSRFTPDSCQFSRRRWTTTRRRRARTASRR